MRLPRTNWNASLWQQLKADPSTSATPLILCTADAYALREQADVLREAGVRVVYKPFDIGAVGGATVLPSIQHGIPVVDRQVIVATLALALVMIALGAYLAVYQGGTAIGSLVWGVVAARLGDPLAAVVGLLAGWRWHLAESEQQDLRPRHVSTERKERLWSSVPNSILTGAIGCAKLSLA
jgi:CheY-like chemotaxis protein